MTSEKPSEKSTQFLSLDDDEIVAESHPEPAQKKEPKKDKNKSNKTDKSPERDSNTVESIADMVTVMPIPFVMPTKGETNPMAEFGNFLNDAGNAIGEGVSNTGEVLGGIANGIGEVIGGLFD